MNVQLETPTSTPNPSYHRLKQLKKTEDKNNKFVHPWDTRNDPDEMYDNPVTNRESWWRCTIKSSPVPGRYDYTDFITEMDRKHNTYGFKSCGRKPSCLGAGALLLPGGYEFQNFIEILSQKPATYRFKDGPRDKYDVLNFGLKDKYINVPPNAYAAEKYLAIDVDKLPVKNSMFKSRTRRFSLDPLKQVSAPPPGTYSIKDITPKAPAITSIFKSKTPRFRSPRTKVPGPGSYAKVYQQSRPDKVPRTGGQYSLFFISKFEAQ